MLPPPHPFGGRSAGASLCVAVSCVFIGSSSAPLQPHGVCHGLAGRLDAPDLNCALALARPVDLAKLSLDTVPQQLYRLRLWYDEDSTFACGMRTAVARSAVARVLGLVIHAGQGEQQYQHGGGRSAKGHGLWLSRSGQSGL